MRSNFIFEFSHTFSQVNLIVSIAFSPKLYELGLEFQLFAFIFI